MEHTSFLNQAEQVSAVYRAECKSKNSHWKGKWRENYTEAFQDAQRHRANAAGQHSVKIVGKTFSEMAL